MYVMLGDKKQVKNFSVFAVEYTKDCNASLWALPDRVVSFSCAHPAIMSVNWLIGKLVFTVTAKLKKKLIMAIVQCLISKLHK